MATNISMIEVLERSTRLIEELNAINKLLKLHIAEQKRQGGQHWNDKYVYDEDEKEYKRIFE